MAQDLFSTTGLHWRQHLLGGCRPHECLNMSFWLHHGAQVRELRVGEAVCSLSTRRGRHAGIPQPSFDRTREFPTVRAIPRAGQLHRKGD